MSGTHTLRGGGGRVAHKPATAAEVVFRCLAVGLFFFFVFVLVPRLAGPPSQPCTTAHNRLETLEDLHAYLLLLAEEQSMQHNAEQAKHLLSLAQQLGGSSSSANNTATQSPQQPQDSNAEEQQQQRAQQAELAAAKLVIRKHEQLLQTQVQEVQRLQAQLQKQHQHHQAAAAAPAAALSAAGAGASSCAADVVRSIGVLGDACGMLPGAELGGDVVIWGGEHKTASAGECCAACLAHQAAIARGVGHEAGRSAKPCSSWVHCSDATACGSRHRECWLKHDPQATSSAAAVAAAGGSSSSSMWTSGVPRRGSPVAAWQAAQLGLPAAAAGDDALAAALTADTAPALLWTTPHGVIRVQLLPELAPGSVRELLRMAAMLTSSGGSCSNCRIYRAEPGFLVQGIVEAPGAYVAVPRHPNPPQRKVLPRGMLCWAGGGGGPDFFVSMIEQSGFGDSHLCFGQVDAAGLAVFERILALPVKPKGGAASVEMMLLQQDVRFGMTLEKRSS